MPHNQAIALDALPAPVTAYLTAHRHHDTTAQLRLFTPGATVTDDGHTHTGTAAITAWMNRTAAAYTYTITPTAAEHTGDDRCTVTQHLTGDFPGGAADLRFHFTLTADLIDHLVIEP
ncbi:nuclear transport factor 2 family protein [Sphaerisporangium aureirubrum]|uniref:Nuclear transport factor 2 family protein n=1 Tax=Sphaerisporangium aureirubrum TaxID=1544736 RepID=A0ABW1NPI4_9ACTN